MDRHRRRRRITALAALSAAFAVSVTAPSLASGAIVEDLLNGMGLGGQQGSGPAAPAAGVPGGNGNYQPPLNGSNPHGQGSVAIGDVTPSDTVPLSGDPAGGSGADQEEIVVGRSRGEQNADGSYHGHITILALFGNELLGVDTGPGETANGPLEPLQAQLLDQICTQTNNALCLEVLKADSETTSSGSTNSFAVLNASVGGANGINAKVASSNGNISSDGTCQTAHGDDNVADASVGGDALTADVAQANSDSQACSNGTSSETHSSKVIQLNGTDIPVPCGSGSPDTEFTPLAPLVTAVCNADDTNGAGEPGSQTSPTYGVREALSLFVLELGGNSALLKATAAGAESHAVAPPGGGTPTTPTTPGGGAGGQRGRQGGGPGGGQGDLGPGGPGGPVSTEAGPGTGDLAFTGANVLILGLIGTGLVIAGLVTTRRAVRHRRATV
jgi:hypothetical protein